MVGVIFLGVGTFILFNMGVVLKGYKKGVGTIVGLKPHPHNVATKEYTKNEYAPVIEYTVQGKSYRFTANQYVKGRWIRPRVGRQVDIYYNPQNHRDAKFAPPVNYLAVGILFVVGALLVFSGVYHLFKSKRR